MKQSTAQTKLKSSYTVETENEHEYKRNRINLNKTSEQFTSKHSEDDKTTRDLTDTENKSDQDRSVLKSRSGRIVKTPERWSSC